MTNGTITDQQVAVLPIHGGRAELLEEIMSRPVDQVDRAEHRLDDAAPRHGRRALATLAAVAAVAITVGGLAAWGIPHQEATRDRTSWGDSPDQGKSQQHGQDPGPTAKSHDIPSVPGGAFVALDQDGWTVTGLFQDSGSSDLFYSNGEAELDLTTYPASQYASYVADRNADASSVGPLTLLGHDAHEWAYGEDDHTVIRSPEGDVFLEVRGTGLNGDDFHAALADLVQTDQAGFAGSLPDGVVTPYNRAESIRHLLRGVDTPPGFTPADVSMSGFNDAYQSSVQVAGAVGCAWITLWAGGTAAEKQAAVDAFDGSRSWPLLQAIADEGGYSSGFWDVGYELRTGHDDKGNPVEADALRSAICS
jgi:hypothetical protein